MVDNDKRARRKALQGILRGATFGQHVAEGETDELSSYFVETEAWRRVYKGDVDLIFGPKGSGKSAIYSLLLSRCEELKERSILVVRGEELRGEPVFRELVTDPPTDEKQFQGLWKLYLLVRVVQEMLVQGVSTPAVQDVAARLKKENLLPADHGLASAVRAAVAYLRRFAQAQSVEGGIDLDPISGMPSGINGKITLGEPEPTQTGAGFRSISHLLDAVNRSLAEANLHAWVVLDRLDVAFDESPDLERNALRALFRAYNDLAGFDRIKPKIFLRDDIWMRLRGGAGMREASHITRSLTLEWNRGSLLNLISRRAARNQEFLNHAGMSEDAIFAGDQASHYKFFYSIFPQKIDVAPDDTFSWILSRTCDGTQKSEPREVVHLLSEVLDRQLAMLEQGRSEPEGNVLFHPDAFQEAMPAVSKERLEQTLLAEYPALAEYVAVLEDEKHEARTAGALAELWRVPLERASQIADQLRDAGFFMRRSVDRNRVYWVPFLYSIALHMVPTERKGDRFVV